MSDFVDSLKVMVNAEAEVKKASPVENANTYSLEDVSKKLQETQDELEYAKELFRNFFALEEAIKDFLKEDKDVVV